jgi:hypothetical protein
MTLEGGGGGGGVFGGITNAISSVGDAIGGVLGTDGGGGGILGSLADFDKGVSKSIPGGWGGLAEMAAVATATYFGGPLGGAAARGAFDYTHGGEDRKNALRNAGEQLVVSYVGGSDVGGALGAGATKAGFQYTHGGADRKNAAKSGIIAGGTQLAMQGAKDYFNAPPDGVKGGMNNEFGSGTSGYGEANDPLNSNVTQNPNGTYTTDNSTVLPDSTPEVKSPDVFNDGYNPDISPDYVKVPGEPGFNIQPGIEPYLGVLPTSNIPTDMTPGTQFEGPNGPEIVAPNGRTYLMKDLESALLNQPVVTPTTPDIAPTETLTPTAANTIPKSVVDTANNFNPQAKLDPEKAFKDLADTPYDSKAFNPADYSAADKEFLKYNTPLTPEQVATNNASAQKQADMGMMDRLAQMPGYTYDAAAQYVKANPLTTAALAYGAYNMLGGQKQQPQPTGQPTEQPYTPPYYGTASPGGLPYILKNKVNASNVYNRTAPTSRYAEGGEVKHFGLGGVANTLTKAFQPFEKAILQPIGKIPGVKEVLPYAGLIAAPFIGSPMAAAGVGALTSGFGTPGSGFNLKRSIMGGIASYGLSNMGAGLEEAGTKPLVDSAPTLNTDVESQAGGFYGNEGKTNQLPGKGDNFFRSPETMSKGVSNFMGSGTYDQAATAFGSKAGMPSATAALMGTTGMMGIDETEKQLKADKAAAAVANDTYQEQMAKIAAGKASAEKAIRTYPYQFATGGEVNPPDDQTGMPNQSPIDFGMGGLSAMKYALGGQINMGGGYDPFANLPNLAGPIGGRSPDDGPSNSFAESHSIDPNGSSNNGGFNMNHIAGMAAGGMPPRFLSGGGDGMSDSIQATIDGKREARLADGEFVVPADVVSGLGNGSSKAGANQLYAMMDRVRKSRTGTVKQGKQINPKKVLKV